MRARAQASADTIRTQEVGTTRLELPLLLKYQSNRRRNTRAYMIGGLKSSMAVTQRQQHAAPSAKLRGTQRLDC
ncbi:MAG: hypothetical protein WKG07_47520 [Hymenobacter sp.]